MTDAISIMRRLQSVLRMQSMAILLAIVANTAGGISSGSAQTTSYSSADEAFAAVIRILGGKTTETASIETLLRVQVVLDQIVKDFSASEYAVQIMFQDTIDGVDIYVLDSRLANSGGYFQATPEETNSGLNFGDFQALGSDANSGTNRNSGFSGTGSGFQSTSADIMRLADALGECYLGEQSGNSGALGVISFLVGPNGELEGVPELVNSENIDLDIRRIYLNAMIALDICSPFPEPFFGQELEATFASDQLVGLTFTAEPEAQWLPSNSDTHEALDLDRGAIAGIQARLSIMGFDPNGIDGSFGRGSRSAISEWQVSESIPSTGYFDQRQLDRFHEDSQQGYDRWIEIPANRTTIENASRVRTGNSSRGSNGWYRDSRGLYCRNGLIAKWCQAARPRNY